MIKKIIGRPKKTFITKKLAIIGIKTGQRVYRVKLGWRRTRLFTIRRKKYVIGKIAVKSNTQDYIKKNKEFIKRLANL